MKIRIMAWLLSFVIVFTSMNIEAFASEGSEEVFTSVVAGETCIPEDVEASDEELYVGYVESLIYGENSSSWTLHNRLTGTTLAAFRILKDLISKTASGELSSTVYKISPEDLGMEQTTWTAEELGIDAIVKNDAISSDAIAALGSKVGIDISALLHTLMSDCPYELYWFDKTAGVSGPKYGISATYTTISVSTDFTFEFYVSSDYAAGTFQVDHTGIRKVQSAVEYALEIVEAYEDEEDYDKLDGYRADICELVDYNDSAAGGQASYGDPWQLISVFDQDDTTKVVCEGYSKAFQYLCDMSEFENEMINCISVTGYMDGGTGAGAHMWNIVTMDNEQNYLVDVTNCDDGTIGAEKQLFLAGYQRGSLDNGYVYQCDAGNILYYYDNVTLNLYESSEITLSSEDYEVVEEHVHVWNSSYTVDRASTCTAEGEKSIHCATCDERKNITAIAKKEHAYGAWVIDKKATESEEGSRYKTCSCGDTVTEKIAKLTHTHVWDSEYTLDKAATTTANGEKSIYCNGCGEKKDTVVIPKIASVKISKTNFVYTGKTLKPTVTVKDSEGNKISSENYSVTIVGDKKSVGTHTLKVTFKGDYSGSKKFTYKINPMATVIKTISPGGSAFTLNWAAVTEEVTGYEIQYASNSTFKNAKTEVVNSASTVLKRVTELSAGTKYYVRIRTYKEVDGNKYTSSWSDKVTVTTSLASTKFNSVISGANSCEIKWDKIEDDAVRYEIECATKSSFADAIKLPVSSASTVAGMITNLKAGTKYYIRIRVLKTVDNNTIYSVWSSTQTVVPKPSSTSISKVSAGAGSFTVTWKKASSDVSGYEIQYAANSSFKNAKKIAVDKLSSVSKKITGVTPGTKYYVRVRTYTKVGTETYYSTWSSKKTATPILGTVSVSSIKANGRAFTLKWQTISNASGYEIQYDMSTLFSNPKSVQVTNAKTVSKKVSGLTAGTKYYVRIRAYRTVDGNKCYSAWSAIKNVIPNPEATTLKSVTAGSKNLTVKWTKVAKQVTGYQIQYAANSSFSKATKVDVSGASKTSKTISGLVKGKKYYVRIRTYRVVNGKTYYSAWSAVKNIKVK